MLHLTDVILSETEIERKAERMMDHLDRVYMSGDMSEKDYRLSVKDLDEWCKAKHAQRKAAEKGD